MARATRSARRATATADDGAERLPEADRLAPFPHTRETVRRFGHHDAARILADALTGGRCHHAWLLTGPEGIGKATLAYAAARFALATPDDRGAASPPDDGADPLVVAADGTAARQVRALSHPGLMLIRRPYDVKDKRMRTVITVDEVRRLRDFTGHTSGGGAWRVVVVDPVDDLNLAAANALLKTLEEPPPRTLFLLICAEPGRLLPTVRSRCRTLALAPLGARDVDLAARQAMAAAELAVPAEEAWARVVTTAGGSVGRALQLVSGGGDAMVAVVDEVFARLPEVNWTAAHKLADDVAPADQSQRFDLFVHLVLERMADVARARLGVADDDAVHGPSLATPASLASWAELWETVVRDKAAADALNLDRKTLVLDTLSKLSDAASVGAVRR